MSVNGLDMEDNRQRENIMCEVDQHMLMQEVASEKRHLQKNI